MYFFNLGAKGLRHFSVREMPITLTNQVQKCHDTGKMRTFDYSTESSFGRQLLALSEHLPVLGKLTFPNQTSLYT